MLAAGPEKDLILDFEELIPPPITPEEMRQALLETAEDFVPYMQSLLTERRSGTLVFSGLLKELAYDQKMVKLQSIAVLLKTSPQLTRIYLNDNRLTNEEALFFLQEAKGNDLRFLDLGENLLTDYFAQGNLHDCLLDSKCEELRLHHNHFKRPSALMLALVRTPIRKLDLSDNAEHFVAADFEFLQHCAKTPLTHLDLSGSMVKGGSYLVAALASLEGSSLQLLRYQRNISSPVGFKLHQVLDGERIAARVAKMHLWVLELGNLGDWDGLEMIDLALNQNRLRFFSAKKEEAIDLKYQLYVPDWNAKSGSPDEAEVHPFDSPALTPALPDEQPADPKKSRCNLL